MGRRGLLMSFDSAVVCNGLDLLCSHIGWGWEEGRGFERALLVQQSGARALVDWVVLQGPWAIICAIKGTLTLCSMHTPQVAPTGSTQKGC
jgi:hypothetical protein